MPQIWPFSGICAPSPSEELLEPGLNPPHNIWTPHSCLTAGSDWGTETTHKPQLMFKASARESTSQNYAELRRTKKICLLKASVHIKMNYSFIIYLPSFHCKPRWLSVFYGQKKYWTTLKPSDFQSYHIKKKEEDIFGWNIPFMSHLKNICCHCIK